jgi:glyoxylase I family protein
VGNAITSTAPGQSMPAVRPIGVHHVSINVGDLAAARRFYVDLLGFTERTDRPDFVGVPGAWLDVGGQQVHLIVGEVPPRLGQHYAVLVPDLDAAVAAMRDRGVRVSDPVEVGTNLQSFTRDPSGNMVEIHEADGVARRARASG